MSHFCGFLQCRPQEQSAPLPADSPRRRQALVALQRSAGHTTMEWADAQLWLATLDIGTWPEGLFAGGRCAEPGNVAVVAGDPLLQPGAAAPIYVRSRDAIAEGLRTNDAGALRDTHGCFAAMCWGSGTQRLALATDLLALRPVYWCQEGEQLLFATSLWLLRSLRQAAEAVDEQGLAELIHFGQPLGQRTVFSGVQVLQPGEMLVWSRGRCQQSRYHDWAQTARSSLTEQDAHAALHEAFSQSVRRRLIPGTQDAFLSGGMDSRAVVAELVDQSQRVRTFCAPYEGSPDDLISREVAKLLGTEHHVWYRQPADRLRVVLDPFAMYAKEQFPGQPVAGGRRIWSGDGGSVTLGHIYMTAEAVSLAEQPLAAEQLTRLFPSLGIRPSRHLGQAQAARMADAAIAGAQASFAAVDGIAPDRRLFLFYMLNDQARHLYHHFAGIDQHGIEFQLPIYDASVVKLVTSLPIDWFLRHRFYNQWIQGFRCGAGSLYWQSYPGHHSSPHSAPAGLRDQWGGRWYSGAEVCRALSEVAGAISETRDPLTAPYINRLLLAAAKWSTRVGYDRLKHEVLFARNLFQSIHSAH